MHDIIIEYDSNGRIARIVSPDFPIFEVVTQSDNYVGGKLQSSRLSNVPVEGGNVNE